MKKKKKLNFGPLIFISLFCYSQSNIELVKKTRFVQLTQQPPFYLDYCGSASLSFPHRKQTALPILENRAGAKKYIRRIIEAEMEKYTLVTRRVLSQFQRLKIRRSAKFIHVIQERWPTDFKATKGRSVTEKINQRMWPFEGDTSMLAQSFSPLTCFSQYTSFKS